MTEELRVVGKSLPRVDAYAKVTGQAKFTVDISLPRMLHGKILRSPHPHARILNVDTTAAERLPGVKAVITGRDTTDMRFAFVDTPRYAADEYPLAQDKVRYIGDEIAAVAAVDLETAQEALDLIKVEYEILPAVFDPFEAMMPDAPAIHDSEYDGASIWEEWGAKRTKKSQAYEKVNNVSGRTFITYGDPDAAFASAYHIREDRFETSSTAHCALEPHAAVAHFDPAGQMHLWLSSMGIYYKRYVIAKVLKMSTSQVRLHKVYVGGAFGGKMDVYSYEICAALLSQKAGRPVRIELTREEVFTTTRLRFPTYIDIKTGVTRTGKILAQHIRTVVNNGGYRGTGPVVIFLFHGWTAPVYRVKNMRYEGVSVWTNNPVGGPQRGHGAPQIRFAIDSQLDMISEDLGLDPAKVMLKNVRHIGDVLPNGDVLNSCGLTDCIKQSVAESGWKAKRGKPGSNRSERGSGTKRRGVGISTTTMISGAPYYPFVSAGIVKLHDDGAASLLTGVVEMGQGAETTLAQIAAEELGLRLEDIRIVSGDTEQTPVDMGSFLSGGALVTGAAIRLAAADAKRQLFEVASERLDVTVEELDLQEGRVCVRDRPDRCMTIGEVVRYSIKEFGAPITGRGSRKILSGTDRYPSLAKGTGRWTDAYGFNAQVAEVEVDIETGIVRLIKATTFHDCGQPLNPQIVDGQVYGCVSTGQGQALTEQIVFENGRVVNPTFLDYRLPLATDTPETAGGAVDSHEPSGPFGAKEVGEGVVAQTLAAIANAVYDAVGVRITSLPITPEKVLQALAEQEEAAAAAKEM
ncbi:MAG TPA: molybdopterin cofactor-binding domain-containing protein [Anaerolineae bacterium]|nr:molybdopterin cofactor-binding domain-containing protein [Anaerolineae bacterium]